MDEGQYAVSTSQEAIEAMVTMFRALNLPLVFGHQDSSQLSKDGTGLLTAVLNNFQNRFIAAAQGPDARLWAQQYPASGLTDIDWASFPPRKEGYLALQLGEGSQVFSVHPTAHWQVLPPDPATLPGPQPVAAWEEQWAPATTPAEQAMDTLIRRWERGDPTTDTPACPREQQVAELIRMPEGEWALYEQRVAAHYAHRRRYILAHPSCIPDRSDRIKWLSRLGFSPGIVRVQVALARMEASFPSDAPKEKRRGGGGGGESGTAGGPRARLTDTDHVDMTKHNAAPAVGSTPAATSAPAAPAAAPAATPATTAAPATPQAPPRAPQEAPPVDGGATPPPPPPPPLGDAPLPHAPVPDFAQAVLGHLLGRGGARR